MRAFLVVKSDIKENPAISRVYFIPRRSEPDSHTVARKMVLDLLQNGSGSVLKSRFRLSFKRWGLPVGL